MRGAILTPTFDTPSFYTVYITTSNDNVAIFIKEQ